MRFDVIGPLYGPLKGNKYFYIIKLMWLFGHRKEENSLDHIIHPQVLMILKLQRGDVSCKIFIKFPSYKVNALGFFVVVVVLVATLTDFTN